MAAFQHALERFDKVLYQLGREPNRS